MACITLKLTQSDITIVKYQIDRKEIRFLSVAKRCRFACPLVIVQDPFLTRGILFPTIYHLSCPRIVKLISRLEASPFFKNLKNSIKKDPVIKNRYIALMDFYRRDLIRHISSLYVFTPDGNLIKNYVLVITRYSDSQINADINNKRENNIEIPAGLYNGLIGSGLAGSREITALKCLHALYGFLTGVCEPCSEAVFFRALIEERIESEYKEEYQNIFPA